jgi:hypothetical protein
MGMMHRRDQTPVFINFFSDNQTTMGRDIAIDGADLYYVAGRLTHYFSDFHRLHTSAAIPVALTKLQELCGFFQSESVPIPMIDKSNENYFWAVSKDGQEAFGDIQEKGVIFHKMMTFLNIIINNTGIITIEGYN